MTQLWVRIIGDGKTQETAFRADFPTGITQYAVMMPGVLDPASPRYGHPAVTFCRVRLSDADALAVRAAGKEIPESDVPESDRLLADLDASTAFDAPTTDALLARAKAMETRKSVLLRAVQLGVAPDAGEAIRVKHAVPSAAQADGIDSEIHAAAVAFVRRTCHKAAGVTLSAEEARLVVKARLLKAGIK